MNNCNESEDVICKLKSSTKKTQKYTLDGCFKLCKVVDVYDGDSCRVVFNNNGIINKWNIRMNGYDSPEMRPSKSIPNRDEIKVKAKKARDYLKSLVCNDEQLVYIKCGEFDKYGRLLGEIYINQTDEVSVNKLMVENGYAYEYHGGTKNK
jgi:endonuclease YncB( thermonuclease family)